MNIVMYGINEANVAAIAAEYGFKVSESLTDMDRERNLVNISERKEDKEQAVFYQQMEERVDDVQAVITTSASDANWLYYATRPDMFYTVSEDEEDNHQLYELRRIIESRLGMITAHEE